MGARIPTLSNDALRRYHDLCEAPVSPEFLDNATKSEHSEWIIAHVSQDDLLQLYLQIWQDISPAAPERQDTSEGQLYSALCLAGDIVWHTMTEETLDRLEPLIRELDTLEACG